jgi:hypothetical protein
MIALTTLCPISIVFQKCHPQLCLIQRGHQSNIFQVLVSTNDQYTNTFRFPQYLSHFIWLSSYSYLTDSRQPFICLHTAILQIVDNFSLIFLHTTILQIVDNVSLNCLHTAILQIVDKHIFLLSSYIYLTDSRQPFFCLRTTILQIVDTVSLICFIQLSYR